MIHRYTVSTFVAWWIGAGIGFIAAALTVGDGWNRTCAAVAIYTGVLYVVYFLLTERGQSVLDRVFRRKTSS